MISAKFIFAETIIPVKPTVGHSVFPVRKNPSFQANDSEATRRPEPKEDAIT
jgi:hypothetical protein